MKVYAFILVLFVRILSPAEEVQPTENTKGCHILGCTNTFKDRCLMEAFIKVANSEWDSNEGEPRIWGYSPTNLQRDRNGKPFYIQILAKDFIQGGRVKGIEHTPCRCHCPNW
jgi:hypothetical protein